MTQSITVFGLASQKAVKIIAVPENLPENLTLINFLFENGITIASSCNGAGQCKKCLVNRTVLSCQITLLNFINSTPSGRVEISYL